MLVWEVKIAYIEVACPFSIPKIISSGSKMDGSYKCYALVQ